MKKISILSISALLFSGFMLAPMSGIIDFSSVFSYDSQPFPDKALYRWNEENPVTDKGATLGRVLFYDTKLSLNSTTACASCHQQENAFGDSRKVSIGFNGEATARHAMRLINVDFHADNKKFWDERSTRLENTVTQPFKDPIEMGFSGENGFPSIDSLIKRMENLSYYKLLFEEAFGDQDITEDRMALALSQFIRSMTTFDSKFDEGFSTIGEEITHFPNFTDEENRGKRLFFNPPAGIFGTRDIAVTTGAACGFCHKAPSFDLIHLSMNNGVIGVAGDSTAVDISVRRSPSLKNLVKPDGSSNGPFMHDGSIETLEEVIEHYNFIPFNSRNELLSGLLFPMDNRNVELQLTDQEKSDLVSFLKTLSGNDIYTNEKWSNPFDENGDLVIQNCISCHTGMNVDTTQTDTSKTDSMSMDTMNIDTLISLNPIFDEFSWLKDLVDLTDCDGTQIDVYDEGTFKFIIINTQEVTHMYFEDGMFYCKDHPGFSCKNAYQLGEAITSWSCKSEMGSFQFSLNTSLISQRDNEDVSVFPNPTRGCVSISVPSHFEQGQIVITNMEGKVIHQLLNIDVRSTKIVNINLEHQPKGLYILKLISSDYKHSRKIILN